MQFLLPFCRNTALHVGMLTHFCIDPIMAYTHIGYTLPHTTHTHSHTKFITPSAVIASALHPHTHQLLQLILKPVEGIKAVTYCLVNLHTLPVMPLHFSPQCYRNVMKSNLKSPTLYPSSSSHPHLPPPPPHLSRGVRDGMEGLILFRPSQPWE